MERKISKTYKNIPQKNKEFAQRLNVVSDYQNVSEKEENHHVSSYKTLDVQLNQRNMHQLVHFGDQDIFHHLLQKLTHSIEEEIIHS